MVKSTRSTGKPWAFGEVKNNFERKRGVVEPGIDAAGARLYGFI